MNENSETALQGAVERFVGSASNNSFARIYHGYIDVGAQVRPWYLRVIVLPLQRPESSSKDIGQLNANLSQDQANEQAHGETLAGSTINTVWDLVAGSAKTREEKADRAHKSDEYAEIAADTFATIPKFKTVVGGLARGVLLADVSGNKSAGEWSKDFALNVAEGALLNKAGKLGSAEGVVARNAGKALGGGLVSELAVHGVSGAAFGAVKSGFQFDTALDKNGHFSTSKYLENLGVGTATGGLIGMPAGAIGSRVGKVVSSSLSSSAESSLIAHTVRNTLTAGSSGFAGGAVFGGVESIRHSSSASDVLAATLKGGMIGFLTGGATGAFEPRINRVTAPLTQKSDTRRHIDADDGFNDGVGERLNQSNSDSRSKPNRTSDKSDKGDDSAAFQDHAETPPFNFEAMAFKPPVHITLREFENQLTFVKTEDRTFTRLRDDAPVTHEQFVAKLADMKKKGGDYDRDAYFEQMTVKEVRKVNIYSVQGLSMKIVVPHEYAQQLDVMRNLRRINEQPSPYDKVPMAVKVAIAAKLKAGDATVLEPYLTATEIKETIPIIQSGQAAIEHPLYNRALPEDLVPILQGLPNPRLVKEVLMTDKRDVEDAYYQVKYNDPKFRAAADVTQDGIITHYQPNRGANLHEITNHEWAHLTKWSSPELGKLFDLASVVDKVAPNFDHKATRLARKVDPNHPDVIEESIYFASEHASRNADENWAVAKGEHFMSSDPDGLYIFAQEAPVRALVLSTALEKTMTLRQRTNQTEQDRALFERIQYVDKVSRPLAIDALTKHLLGGSVEQKSAAAKLLGLYGDATAIGALRKAAMDPANRSRPDWHDFNEAFNPFDQNPKAKVETVQTVASTALDAMVKLSADNNAARMRFALREAFDNPTLRPLIAENWPRYSNGFIEYQHFIQMYDKPSHVNRMQKLVELRLQADPDGRKMVFDEIMRLTNGDTRAQTGFLLRNYEHVPGLRLEVIGRFDHMIRTGQLSGSDRLQALQFFGKIPRKDMPPLLEKQVDKLLTQMEKEQNLDDNITALKRPGRNKVQSIHELAAAKDSRAIKPLLEQAISGNPETQVEALTALGSFTPNVVKFYARELRREPTMNELMKRRLDQLISRGSYKPG